MSEALTLLKKKSPARGLNRKMTNWKNWLQISENKYMTNLQLNQEIENRLKAIRLVHGMLPGTLKGATFAINGAPVYSIKHLPKEWGVMEPSVIFPFYYARLNHASGAVIEVRSTEMQVSTHFEQRPIAHG